MDEPNADRIQIDLLIEILGVLRDVAENTSNDKPATVRVTAGVVMGVLGGLWLYTLTVLVPLLALAMCVR